MRKLFGGLLIAGGVLITTVSGLCGALSSGQEMELWMLAFLIGVGCIWGGVAMIRAARAADRQRYSALRPTRHDGEQ